jgi:hypothetical protein
MTQEAPSSRSGRCDDEVVALMMVLFTVMWAACNKSGDSPKPSAPSARSPTTPAAEPTADTAPPNPQSTQQQEMKEFTHRELALIEKFGAEHVPVLDPEPTIEASETSIAFAARHRKWEKTSVSTVEKFKNQARTFCLNPGSFAFRDCKGSGLTKFLKEQSPAITGMWQCCVHDIERIQVGVFPHVGMGLLNVEVQCAMPEDSEDKFDYAIWARMSDSELPKKGRLYDLAQTPINIGAPKEGKPNGMVFMHDQNFMISGSTGRSEHMKFTQERPCHQ